MMHLARDLCGGQICVTPDAASFRRPRDRPLAREVLPDRRLGSRGPPQAARLRARPAQLRLRGPPADVPALRAVAAVRAPARRLPQLRLLGPARSRPEALRRACPSDAVPDRRRPSPAGRPRMTTHGGSGRSTRATPIPSSSSTTTSARPSSPGNTVTCAVRSAQDLETARVGRPSATSRRRPSARWRTSRSCSTRPARALEDICKVTVYLDRHPLPRAGLSRHRPRA